MLQSIRGPLALCALLAGLAGTGVSADARPLGGWDLEKDVDEPSYAVAEPTTTDVNIDTVVLSCEQGPSRRGLQLRLYLLGPGRLAPQAGGPLKDDPTFEIVIDGKSHAAKLYFADDFVLVADAADGATPILSDALLDKLQRGQRMELRFGLVQKVNGPAPAYDSTAVVDLRAGRGAVASVRRCADGKAPQIAEKPRR